MAQNLGSGQSHAGINKPMLDYLKELGVSLDDLRVDDLNYIYILLEGRDQYGRFMKKEVNLPLEYQSPVNVGIVRDCIAKNEERSREETDDKRRAEAEDRDRSFTINQDEE